jgi:hypothetical protein
MVLNHAKNGDFGQEGIYIAATEALDNPFAEVSGTRK